MSLYDKMICTGPTGCGHPRHEHTGNHLKGTRTACRHRIAQGRGTCACTQFKEIRTSSSGSEGQVEAT